MARDFRRLCDIDKSQRASPRPSQIARQNKHNKERAMMDVLMLVLALLLFAAAIGYTYACERL